MRSIVGVGITPPKVLGTPKPASSVMMSRTLGALFGGRTRGAHHGFDCSAPSLITPPNFGSGGGSCLPVMVVVALGEPGTPVICCAKVEVEVRARRPTPASRPQLIFMTQAPLPLTRFKNPRLSRCGRSRDGRRRAEQELLCRALKKQQ